MALLKISVDILALLTFNRAYSIKRLATCIGFVQTRSKCYSSLLSSFFVQIQSQKKDCPSPATSLEIHKIIVAQTTTHNYTIIMIVERKPAAHQENTE